MTNSSSEKKLQAKAELAKLLEQKAILKASENFYTFVKLTAPLMLNGDTYRDGRHIAELAKILEEVHEGSINRLMISLPPGSMKSVLMMMFSAWCLGRNPTWRIVWVSHTAQKAEECSGQVRDLLESPEYQAVFPHTQVREDRRGITHWYTTQGGYFLPKGAGAAIAGYRFNLGIIDDPLSEQTAYTEERTKINKWYPGGFRSRKLPDSRIVIVMTRWHTRDLIGHLTDHAERTAKGDQWEIISVPAILNDEAAEWLGLPAGGSYWPEYMTLEDLETTQADMPPSQWAALYLQSPSGEDGNIFKAEHFRDWTDDKAPICVEVIMSIDTSFGKNQSADFSVIQVWGIFMTEGEEDEDGYKTSVPNLILLQQRRKRWQYPDLRRIALEEYRKWKPDKVIIEDKASGQSLIQDLRLNRLPLLPFKPDRDKVARAHAVTGIAERGRIWLPKRKAYAAELIKEALEFPKGANDDAVDTMVMAILYLRRKYELTQEIRRPRTKVPPKGAGYWQGVRRRGR